MPSCNICNYNTLRIDNLLRHYKTQKHIYNEKNKNYCNICKKCYSSIISYNKHNNKYHNNANTNTNTNTNTNINNSQQIDMSKIKSIIINSNREISDKIDESNRIVNRVVNNAINKASSLISYLMQYHATTPPLKKLNKNDTINLLKTNYKYLEENNDYSLQIEIIRQIKNGTFIKKISRIILNILNHKHPQKQPIYNTDCNRNHYVIKTQTTWNEDKAGIKFTSYVVSPILQYIREIITEYRIYIENKINNNSYDALLNDAYGDVLKIELDLIYETYLNDILTKLSPYLRYFEEINEFDTFNQVQQIQENLERIISDDDNYDNSCDDSYDDVDDDDKFTKFEYINYKKFSKRII